MLSARTSAFLSIYSSSVQHNYLTPTLPSSVLEMRDILLYRSVEGFFFPCQSCTFLIVLSLAIFKGLYSNRIFPLCLLACFSWFTVYLSLSSIKPLYWILLFILSLSVDSLRYIRPQSLSTNDKLLSFLKCVSLLFCVLLHWPELSHFRHQLKR